MSVKLTSFRDPLCADTLITARVSDISLHSSGDAVLAMAMEKIAQAVADEYIRTHFQDILAAMDPSAVANLAVADAAAAIRQTVDNGVRQMHADMQKSIAEQRRPREVLTPGFFGVKRSVIQ